MKSAETFPHLNSSTATALPLPGATGATETKALLLHRKVCAEIPTFLIRRTEERAVHESQDHTLQCNKKKKLKKGILSICI